MDSTVMISSAAGGLPALRAGRAARDEPGAILSRTMRQARWVLGATALGLIVPLAVVPISGAVIAPGEVAVASHVKKIAHPRGGVVAAIPVSNGTRVRAGQLLMRLDTNVSAASAAMTVEGIDQLLARQARLRAERDALPAIAFPAELAARSTDPQVAGAVAGERRIFALNRSTLAGQRASLAAQIAQAGKAAGSYHAQANVFRQQGALIAEERRANDQLWEKRFTTLQRRNELARAAVGLDGNVASAEAQASQLRSRVAELREQMFVLEQDSRRQAGAELAQVEQKLVELKQNNVVAQDANERNLIRAPYAGVVDKLAFTTVGGVIPAGETIMEIVPDADPLVISARIAPADIDEVSPGQEVVVRFSAFDSGTTPELKGRLTRLAADRTIDPQHGRAFYTAEVMLERGEAAKLGGLKLRAGMPAESFIRTGTRSLLGYLFKPLANQFARAFR